MENYCVSCKKYTASENSSFTKTKLNRLMLFMKLRYLWKEKINFYKK